MLGITRTPGENCVMGLNPSEKSITMSIPTFIALVSLLAAGIFSYGMTQGDINTLKRDVASGVLQIEKLDSKIDRLTTMIYEDRRDLKVERETK